MICVDVKGGLGNQLFQYATAFALAKRNNDLLEIDISHLDYEYQKEENVTVRSYQLGNFDITARICNYKPIYGTSLFARAVERFRHLKLVGNVFTSKFLQEANPYLFDEKIVRAKGNVYLCGYFQSWKYFNDIKDELFKELKVNPKYISDNVRNFLYKCSNEESVAVHVRRGDYINTNGWLIDERFYLQAIELMNKELKDKDLKFYVFCEDLSFVKVLFASVPNVNFVSARNEFTDFEEFYIMSQCKHQIISNSSFSWWAAYLNTNVSKNVIAPVFKQWTRDYYPNEWITIDKNYWDNICTLVGLTIKSSSGVSGVWLKTASNTSYTRGHTLRNGVWYAISSTTAAVRATATVSKGTIKQNVQSITVYLGVAGNTTDGRKLNVTVYDSSGNILQKLSMPE